MNSDNLDVMDERKARSLPSGSNRGFSSFAALPSNRFIQKKALFTRGRVLRKCIQCSC